jgi:hypothetical protein
MYGFCKKKKEKAKKNRCGREDFHSGQYSSIIVSSLLKILRNIK